MSPRYVMSADQDPSLAFPDARAWSAWLKKHHASSRGVWLHLAKKGATIPLLTYAQALEVALTWGWIDGQKRSNDSTSWLQRFTPRTAVVSLASA